MSCVARLATPCAAQYSSSSPFTSRSDLRNALYNCNPNYWSNQQETYENCYDSYGVHISDWDVSAVQDMNWLFNNGMSNQQFRGFNADISNWDVSSVTNMERMFYYAQNFNRDISNWDVSSVTNMNYMFEYASNFDGDLSNWNTANTWSSVNARYNAYGMFNGATAWQNKYAYRGVGYNSDGPPEDWCLNDGSRCPFPRDGVMLKVAVANCLNANPDGNCDCSWVDCKHGIGHPIREWDVSKVTDMSSLFKDGQVVTVNNYSPMSYQVTINSHNFNADISRWNTQSLHSMHGMFENAKSFNVDITKWTCDAYEADRSRTNVENMFKGADAWHASYVNTHTGYFDLNLGPPNMWVPVDEYHGGDSFFSKDKRVQILIAFVAVLGALVAAMGIFLIVRCVTHRKRTAKKVTTQFRIAHAHNAVSQQQQILGMPPMPPGPPMLPGRSPIVVTLPAASPPAQQEESQQV